MINKYKGKDGGSMKNKVNITRKNYSFYMPDDFEKKIVAVQNADESLKPLSRSQALYAIVSKMAQEVK